MNSADSYRTKIYELNFIENSCPIKVIGIEEVKARVKLPGLPNIVTHFINKGYSLADEFLMYDNDEISGLDFVLGNLDGNVLPASDVLFGSTPHSVYQESQLGILLTGSVARMKRNLHMLEPLGEKDIHCRSTDESPKDCSIGEMDIDLHSNVFSLTCCIVLVGIFSIPY